MALAEEIYDAVNESTPKQLKAGEWHIPFEDKIHIDGIQGIQFTLKDGSTEYHEAKWTTEAKIKISTAMAAHTSYTIVGGEAVKSYEKWIELHDKLIAYDPPHSSPMEHCARAMSDEEYECFLKGEREINKNATPSYSTDGLAIFQAEPNSGNEPASSNSINLPALPLTAPGLS